MGLDSFLDRNSFFSCICNFLWQLWVRQPRVIIKGFLIIHYNSVYCCFLLQVVCSSNFLFKLLFVLQNIPYKFSMAHLPNSKIKIVLQNLKGECWTVNSVPTTRVNTSHTLCGGWIAFVRCNDIKVGDICIFELVRECELRVHILGVGREGLDCQNGKVACSRSSGGRAPSSHKTPKVLPKKTKGKSPKASKRRQEAPFSIDVRKQCSASKTYTRAPVGSQSKAANKKLGKVFNYILFEFAVKNWFQ